MIEHPHPPRMLTAALRRIAPCLTVPLETTQKPPADSPLALGRRVASDERLSGAALTPSLIGRYQGRLPDTDEYRGQLILHRRRRWPVPHPGFAPDAVPGAAGLAGMDGRLLVLRESYTRADFRHCAGTITKLAVLDGGARLKIVSATRNRRPVSDCAASTPIATRDAQSAHQSR